MKFRNSSIEEHQTIKTEEYSPNQNLRSSTLHQIKSCSNSDMKILVKIADIIVNLHERCLLKCQNLEIYRDLNSQEQELLLLDDKNSFLHTILAGALAIDSCLKAYDREQKFVMDNLLRTTATLISHYKNLEGDLAPNKKINNRLKGINDSIKFLIQQFQTLPFSKCLNTQLEKQLTFLESTEATQRLVNNFQGLVNESKMQQKQQRKTAYSQRLRMKIEKNSQNDRSSRASIQQICQQLNRVQEQLQEKSTIVIRMNEEFTLEMQKYNSVFRRLEEQNRILKKYNDIDTSYLLEELEIEIDSLRGQRLKEQTVINDIRKKIDGISYSKVSLANTEYQRYHHNYQPYNAYQYAYHPQTYASSGHSQQYQQRHVRRFTNNHLSPKYFTKISPFQIGPYQNEDHFYPSKTVRTRVAKRQQFRLKSKSRYQGFHQNQQKQPRYEYR